MRHALYLSVAFFATAAGGLTGIGGGVVIKPVLDIIGDYPVVNIGILSSCAVFAMTATSLAHHFRRGVTAGAPLLSALGVGSVAGGVAGERILQAFAAGMDNGRVVLGQNLILALMTIGILFYTLNKHRIESLRLHGALPAVAAGAALGVIASFLGIGGGPANVALLMYLFGFDAKTASIASLTTIFFSQASKLFGVALAEGFAPHDLTMLPVMLAGAVAGGWLGARLNRKLPERMVAASFNIMQIVVLAACIFNMSDFVFSG